MDKTQQQSNLSPHGKNIEISKQSLKLTDVQREVIIGTLLGDASMSLRKGKPCYSIKFEQGEDHVDYVNHLYELFEPFVGTPPTWRWIDKDKTRRALWFRTYRHDSLIFYWNLFYRSPGPQGLRPGGEEKRKIVSKTIGKLLTPRVLAYWFMDDGNQTSDNKTYYLNTQGFSKHESEMLCELFKEKFNIIASVHKDKESWRIYVWCESSETFRTLVEPYVISCFDYRLKLKIV